ncbi:hypothetical protein ACF08W_28835 [Streptomyces sp. NPDC015144]|uniref:hypothetical protein n=1 Tax=Streptomyces sp. NPDC015144 TaxID=3364944 RepID=UPI0036F8FE23
MDPNTMYSVDLSGPAPDLGMQAWIDDRDSMPRVVFAAEHRIETFGTDGSAGPDPFLHGLRTDGWAEFNDFPGWADPAPGWSAVLDVATDELTMSNPDGVSFYQGTLNSSRTWRRSAKKNRMFIALAGDIADPRGIADAVDAGRMYALVCPIIVAMPGRGQ